MATVIWRCPACGHESASRGWCPIDEERLEAAAVAPAAAGPEAAAPGPEAAGPAPEAAGRGPEAAGPGPDRAPRRIVLALAGGQVEVPAAGLLVGRAVAPFRDLPGMQALRQVSRATQARLYWEGDTLYVVDAGSTNGTFVDDVQLTGPTPVRPGSRLRFGLDVPVEVTEVDEFGMTVDQDRG
jgi:FHA domain